MVGMRRPKKQEVEARAEVCERRPPLRRHSTSCSSWRLLPLLLLMRRLQPHRLLPRPSPLTSPGSLKRQAAEEELEELAIEMEVAEKVSAHMTKQLTMRHALHDAKMRRVEAAQKRKARGSAVLQLERIYQSQIELLNAKLNAAEASSDAHSAEANYLAQQCAVLRLDIACLKRSVR